MMAFTYCQCCLVIVTITIVLCSTLIDSIQFNLVNLSGAAALQLLMKYIICAEQTGQF